MLLKAAIVIFFFIISQIKFSNTSNYIQASLVQQVKFLSTVMKVLF